MKASCRSAYGSHQFHGRLGNRLLCLSATLVQAVDLNLCFAWIQPGDAAYIGQILDIPAHDHIMDMTVQQDADKAPMYTKADHCRVDHWDPWDIARGSQLLQDYFVSSGRLRCDASLSKRPEVGPEGVVMHMRSGDIMQYSSPAGLDPQPPCRFYSEVLEKGNNGSAFSHALIVTQPDYRNPCIATLKKWFPTRVTVQSHSVNEDACLIATAENVVVASWSTWDTALTRLNVNLKNLYIPMGEDGGAKYYLGSWWNNPTNAHFLRWIVREQGMPYAQHIYSFPGFSTWWHDWGERVRFMVNYNHPIVKRTIPALSRLEFLEF
jgi:hypothetical protein